MIKRNQIDTIFIRNFIFGVEDSLVSTVGLLSGVASAGLNRNAIFVSGVVLIFVEAFSMGVGSFLSEDIADQAEKKKNNSKTAIKAAAIMLISYFISGFIPLSPYIFFETSTALPMSIVFSLIALFALGALAAKTFKINIFTQALKMLILGGMAIGVGVVVGNFIK